MVNARDELLGKLNGRVMNQLSEIRYRLDSILYLLGGYINLFEKTIHEILKKEKENGQEHAIIIE